MEALHILEKTLNMKIVSVTKEVNCTTNKSGKKRVIDENETIEALEKQKKLIKEFQRWVWTDPNRKERLEIIFENQFSCVKTRMFDGSFLTFPGMSDQVHLYPYQKDAVARIIFTPNTLLAHDVGAGKTYVMIAAGQELRRMGLSKKNMYVVPNSIVGQWRNIFEMMYPGANMLVVEPKTFTPKKREKVLSQIKNIDYDGIIMAYSCFEQIPLSKDYYIDELKNKKKIIKSTLNKRSKATLKLRRKEEAINKALAELINAIEDSYDSIYFDELGITRLFIDEAQNYKNVPIDTKINNVLGINGQGSKRCKDVMDKVHMIQKMNEGKGVVLATGTPITNSITDVFVMQQYLQSGELGMLDLQNFDSWIGMFAEKSTEFEIDVDTNSYRLATRFSKFHNLPELTTLLASVADFHQVDESAGIPEFDGYHDALLSKTPAFAAFLDDISQRADDVRSGTVNRRDDNMLKITTDGRKAALDLRLVDPNAMFTYQSKVVMLSVPDTAIAYIHDANTEKERNALFSEVRSGKIRILIGSTFKLGLGVNVQNKLIALHHLDVPWRPADMIQREGRILRQGNENKKVEIYRYITEGSFDAYSWQLLETKQRFITDLLSGSLTERSGSDIDDTVLDYAEVKALAVGNPLVKERVEATNELNRYRKLQHKLIDSRIKMEKELLEIPGKISHQRDMINGCEKDAEYYAEWKALNPLPSDNNEKKKEAESRRELREVIGESVRENILEIKEKKLISYRGFDIILPANMKPEKPYVWLKRDGKYYVELGDTDIGNLIRIDNYLDSLPDYLDEFKRGLDKMLEKEKDLKQELAKDESYSDKIEEYKKIVEDLDRKLGVDTNE